MAWSWKSLSWIKFPMSNCILWANNTPLHAMSVIAKDRGCSKLCFTEWCGCHFLNKTSSSAFTRFQGKNQWVWSKIWNMDCSIPNRKLKCMEMSYWSVLLSNVSSIRRTHKCQRCIAFNSEHVCGSERWQGVFNDLIFQSRLHQIYFPSNLNP